jgi:putative methionine-R-sulfoxide reductase with GAF domain
VSSRALGAIDRILDRGGDADDVLRAVVAELARAPGVEWAGILFLEHGELVLGPEAGVPDEGRRLHVPVAYQGAPVGALAIDGAADAALLERTAAAISAQVLLGWDTGGEAWEP